MAKSGGMLRAFSDTCLSLDGNETFSRPTLVEKPHVLGPGTDYFTKDGNPVRPQPCAHTLQKAFSGSTLDLNAMNGDIFSEEDAPQVADSWNFLAKGGESLPLQGVMVSTIINQVSCETEKERAKSAKNKTNVLVIGGFGYTSCHIVAKLLDAGYTVRVTVPDMLGHQQMDRYSMGHEKGHHLSVFEANVTNSTALRDAMRGCKYVIHCGCPITTGQQDIVDFHLNAVQALFHAIRGVGKTTVKRVVITGTASSVFHVTDPYPPSGIFDESCWNKVVTSSTDPLLFARLSFEKEAWRLKHMFGVELVVILPSNIIGPSLTGDVSDAVLRIRELATAPSYFPYAANLYWNFVDVRDVAEAHVRALECQEVKDQRVIVSNGCYSYAELAAIIKKTYPHLTPPTRTANTFVTLFIGVMKSQIKLGFLWHALGVRKELDSHRAVADLEMKFTPLPETIRACIDQMIRTGEVPAQTPRRATGRRTLRVAAAAAGFAVVAVVAAQAVVLLRRRNTLTAAAAA